RLEEEQPLVQKLSAETPFPVHIKKMPDEPMIKNDVSEVVENEFKNENSGEIKFFLEEEKEEKKTTVNDVEEEWEPQLKTEPQQPLFTEEIRFEEEAVQEEAEEELTNDAEKASEEEFPET